MYAAYFGLSERPFSLAPDPRYLYLSDAHREALAHLLYGLGEGGSFVQLTGEVGTGKTTVCRALLEQLPPDVDVAMIFNPRLTSVELLATVADDLGARPTACRVASRACSTPSAIAPCWAPMRPGRRGSRRRSSAEPRGRCSVGGPADADGWWRRRPRRLSSSLRVARLHCWLQKGSPPSEPGRCAPRRPRRRRRRLWGPRRPSRPAPRRRSRRSWKIRG